LDLLLSRRSGTAKAMTEPGPDKKELALILQAAARVPDHGKLFPWRFIVFEGKGRKRMGEILADAAKAAGEKEKHQEQERERFLRAPVVVGVVSRVTENIKIPEWEQVLSSGAVCQNMLLAAHSLGFVANWLTEWCAYDAHVKEGLGLKPGERIAGFVYIGTSDVKLEERPRPNMDEIVTWF
jgi:nitroreductase